MAWEEPFDRDLTADWNFALGPGKDKKVPFMARRGKLRYAAGEGFKIAALPYAGKTYQFVVIVPDKADGLAAVEAKLTAKLLAQCVALPETEMRLSIPRLKMSPPILPMKDMLTKLGMGMAFTKDADFRPMADAKLMAEAKLKIDLMIDDVYHRAFIEVDESGTKAAAATAAGMVEAGGIPPRVPELKADRPFIFLIQDLRSGACLFIGRVVEPDSPPAEPAP
jgi:serpin B